MSAQRVMVATVGAAAGVVAAGENVRRTFVDAFVLHWGQIKTPAKRGKFITLLTPLPPDPQNLINPNPDPGQ